jgi:hypothetical protein
MSERRKAFSALLSGKLPVTVVEKEVVKIVRVRTGSRPREGKGVVDVRASWTSKQPHPAIMPQLEKLNKDPEIETAITVKTQMIGGSGFHTEMGKDVKEEKDADGQIKPHPNRKKIDDWSESINADEKIALAVRVMYEKGFSATEIDPDDEFSLKVLPSDAFFIWRNKLGEVLKYTEEINSSTEAIWKGPDLKNIMLLVHKETPENPYGRAVAECLAPYIEAREQMAQDGPAVLHKIGYPLRRWESQDKAIMDMVYEQATSRDPDEDLFLDGIGADELRVVTEQVNARVNFEGFITSINSLIAEGLFSPLMNYIRNATEASATKMLDIIHEYNEAQQRYVARRVQKCIFERLCGSPPIPRVVWGSPRTGMEDVKLADVAALVPTVITFEQGQDLLKKLGLPLMDAPLPKPNPLADLGKLPLLDQPRMQTVQASLQVIKDNYEAKNLDFKTACVEASKAIDVHVRAARQVAMHKIAETLGHAVTELSPESEQSFRLIKQELNASFREILLPTGAHEEHGSTDKHRTFLVRVPGS